MLQIARAIELIYAQPEHGRTVGEFASKVAMSRSAFSARCRKAFERAFGAAPGAYRQRPGTPQVQIFAAPENVSAQG